jgi:hypothetical protein
MKFVDTYGTFLDALRGYKQIWRIPMEIEQGGDIEVTLNIDSEKPIEIWLKFPAGMKANITMSPEAAKELAMKLIGLAAAYRTMKKKEA